MPLCNFLSYDSEALLYVRTGPHLFKDHQLLVERYLFIYLLSYLFARWNIPRSFDESSCFLYRETTSLFALEPMDSGDSTPLSQSPIHLPGGKSHSSYGSSGTIWSSSLSPLFLFSSQRPHHRHYCAQSTESRSLLLLLCKYCHSSLFPCWIISSSFLWKIFITPSSRSKERYSVRPFSFSAGSKTRLY